MTLTRFPSRVNLPAAELLRGCVALAALLLFLPGPAPAAEFTRDHRAQANAAGADRFADAVALAYALPQADRRSKLLEQAVQDARDSLKLEPRYAVHAYAAMGSALEKLAWMVEGNAEKFEKAVEALEVARTKTPRNVRSWI